MKDDDEPRNYLPMTLGGLTIGASKTLKSVEPTIPAKLEDYEKDEEGP
jgi:hypothetical protein